MKNKIVIFLTLTTSTFAYSNVILDELEKPLTIPTTRNVLISGVLLSAAMLYIDKDFDKHNQRQIAKHKLSDKTLKFGNEGGQIIPALSYIAINAALSSTENGTIYQKRAVDMFNAVLYSGIVTDVLKPVINETRPSGGHYSFPSGHSTTAFAFASYVGLEHGWKWGVPAYALAAYVGYSRIASGFHYPHDVVAGAAIGMAYGMSQYYKNYLNVISFTPMLTPVDQGKGLAFTLTKEF